MYYKIINTDSEIYKELHAHRTKELNAEKRNWERIKKIVALDFDAFLGKQGQLNYKRTSSYRGFRFRNNQEIEPKVWIEDATFPGYFVPNRRTKVGREMAEMLSTDMIGFDFRIPYQLLGLEFVNNTQFPFLEIGLDEVIVIELDNEYHLHHPDIIEITETEFAYHQ